MVQDPGNPGKRSAGQRTDFSQIEAHIEEVGWQLYGLALLLGERLKIPEMLDLAESIRRSNVGKVRRAASVRAAYVGTGEEPKAGSKKGKKAVTQAVPGGVTEDVTGGLPRAKDMSDKEWAAALLKDHPAFKSYSPGG